MPDIGKRDRGNKTHIAYSRNDNFHNMRTFIQDSYMFSFFVL